MLLIFGVTVVVLGILQMRNTIYNPFAITEDDSNKNKALSIYENDQVKLQSLDTDHDGLNDYEEIQFFATSPYLPDTDQDGIDDKKEIDQKTDPLCPKGENCNKAKEVPIISVSEKGITPLPGAEIKAPQAAQTAQTQNPYTNESGNIDLQGLITDPQQLRAIMLQSGSITQEQLDKIDDATLRQMAQKLYKEKFVDINAEAASTNGGVVSSSKQ